MSVTEIPYFEGDFWPSVIEKNIKELNQEEREELEQEVGGGVCAGGEVSKGKLPGKSVYE